MSAIVLVGAGGFIGSVLRYALGLVPTPGDYPLMTMLINFTGAVAIGVISEFSVGKGALSPNAALFLRTGLCGGFTTFSAFSLETAVLFQRGRFFTGAAYTVLSVVVCLAGVYAGMAIARTFKSHMAM